MQTNGSSFVLKYLDLLISLSTTAFLFLVFLLLANGSDYAGPIWILFAMLILPVFITAKYLSADFAWRLKSKNIIVSDGFEFFTGNKVRSETFYELPLAILAPHTYSEFRGGDSVQRLSTRNFPNRFKISLSGIYQELSEHVFYCRQEDKIEALSLYTPEVLEIITNQNVRCAIETSGNKLRIYSHPSSFIDIKENEKLKNLSNLIRIQINERARSFNTQEKIFKLMELKRSSKFLTNLTDQAKLTIMATTAIAVLTLTYADNVGSGDIVSPLIKIPDWLGFILLGFVFFSPLFILIVFLNLQRLSTTIRKPVKTVKVGATHISRSVLIYIFLLLVLFVILLLASTDTAT
jgi:hypothetical protein